MRREVGGVVLTGVGISRGDIVFIFLSIVGAAIEFVLSFAFLVVFTTTKEILFPQESHEEPTVAIQCENGHNVPVTKGQAGSSMKSKSSVRARLRQTVSGLPHMALTLAQIEAEYQIVTADIRFLTENEGGRRTSIDLFCDVLYRPEKSEPKSTPDRQITN